jgi:hypothetical protein
MEKANCAFSERPAPCGNCTLCRLRIAEAAAVAAWEHIACLRDESDVIDSTSFCDKAEEAAHAAGIDTGEIFRRVNDAERQNRSTRSEA